MVYAISKHSYLWFLESENFSWNELDCLPKEAVGAQKYLWANMHLFKKS